MRKQLQFVTISKEEPVIMVISAGKNMNPQPLFVTISKDESVVMEHFAGKDMNPLIEVNSPVLNVTLYLRTGTIWSITCITNTNRTEYPVIYANMSAIVSET